MGGSLLQSEAILRRQVYRLVILLLIVCSHGGDATAEIYTWVDRDGQVHFSDNEASIPPEDRDQALTRPSSLPSEFPSRPSPSAKAHKDKRSKPLLPRLSTTGGRAKVLAVIGGDTIVVSGGEKVRYLGLNTPETHHPDKLPEYCGQEAFEANRRLVAGKTVRLEFDARRRDKYGRLLAYVYVDNLFVNAELIRQGYAQVSTYKENQRHHEEFERLQHMAVTTRRGLWGGCVEPRWPQELAQPNPEGRWRRP